MRSIIAWFLPSTRPLSLPPEDLRVSLNYAKRVARIAPQSVESSIGQAQEMAMMTYAEPVAGSPLDLIEMLNEVRQ